MSNNMNGNKYSNEDSSGIEEAKLKLEKQVAVGVWIKAIGQIIELVGLTRLNLISEESIAEKQILSAVSIQTFGSLLDAIGVTNQISQGDREIVIDAQKLAITGDFLQSLGSALEVVGGIDALREEQEKFKLFIP